ncbi:outer membrane beta-barrel protein [Pararhizobium mangrovi]|uniref:Outer membrane beta-barrel protein n=1 Tax=Pararhizobium mangrovi TaxID=2590452 RepID=A0A506U6E5_9HYPH|nr:outer membrane beta-barrel protein [Pararhizobium mangrovi]TPW29962.1 hypothetical protein FJU11_06770 [Pararhizobium mangrovi]
MFSAKPDTRNRPRRPRRLASLAATMLVLAAPAYGQTATDAADTAGTSDTSGTNDATDAIDVGNTSGTADTNGLDNFSLAGSNLQDDGTLRGLLSDDAAPLDTNQDNGTTDAVALPPVPSEPPAEPAPVQSRENAISGTASPNYRGDLGRLNRPENSIAPRGTPPPDIPLDQAPGIRRGVFVLRPEITQSIGAESRKLDGRKTSRIYSQSEIDATLLADWGRRTLTVEGSGIYQKNISGDGATEPSASIDADFALDLAEATTADFTANYDFRRESVTDENAVENAERQATIQTIGGGAKIARELAKLRGTLAAHVDHTAYGDVKLADGTTLSQDDRDALSGEIDTRVDYRPSGVLTPFLQASYERKRYDQRVDDAGYRRSSNTYRLEAGVNADFGEKLGGELATGYVLRRFEDDRLSDLDGLALDGSARWSPHRGTNISLDLATRLEDATAAGRSGPITYSLATTLEQQVRYDVVATLSAGYLRRNYLASEVADENAYSLGLGVRWYLTHDLAIDAEAAYAVTRPEHGEGDRELSATLGLTARR